jgi:uncharacterized damage-inducible protein DinB
MATLQAEQALFLRQFMLAALEREHATTRRVIEAIPIDKGDYRPDEIVKSANDLAWHIVGAEHRFMDAVVNGAFDFSNTGRPDDLRTSSDIARWYGDRFPKDAARVAALPADALTRMVDFRGIFQFPAVVYLQTAQIHSIHHRGQLSMYLRPMGAKVPAIYGESFDSAQAKQSTAR